MSNPVLIIRFKLFTFTLLTLTLVYLITSLFRNYLILEMGFFLLVCLYFLLTDREKLFTLLNFFKFLVIIVLIFHLIFFIFKGITMGWDYSITYYIERWEYVVIQMFIIPNIFGLMNILISRFDFIDIILITNNKNYARIFYILMISGIEVMRRLRIHYEYHPLNYQTKFKEKVVHYLAIPLTLFFGIHRGFESKYNTLLERDKVLRGKDD